MAGFYVMQRGWMDHPMFGSVKREPYGKRGAWMWLVEHAAWKPVEARIEGQTVILARGELSVTIQDMGSQWGWPTTKVADFIRVLCGNCAATTKKVGKRLVITICNYDDFASPASEEFCPSRINPGQNSNKNGVDARAFIKAEQVEQEEEEVGSLRSPTARAKPKPDFGSFAVWYAEYPHKVGRGAAEKAYPAALARASPDELIEGLRRYIASKPPDRRWCAPAVWLNQQRWLDEPAENDGATPNVTRPSGVASLYEGALRAADKFDRQGGRGADCAAPIPLLDFRRSR